jgi:hypothetical protein
MKYLIFFMLCCLFHLAEAQGGDSGMSIQKGNSSFIPSTGIQNLYSDLFDFGKAYTMPLPKLSNPYRIPTIDHLPGMFCKMEYRLEKKNKLAPRFRLGSLQYTEWMEGKQEFYARYYK